MFRDDCLSHALQNKLRLLPAKLISFDVFDTLIFRRAVDSHFVFRVVAHHAGRTLSWKPGIGDAFLSARLSAELRCIRDGQLAPSLAQIYQKIRNDLGFDEEVMQMLQDLEMAAESDILYSIESSKKAVAAARSTGALVIFVSDMYLSEAFLRSILKREQLIEDHETLYVSSERGVTKASGGLYRLIRSELKPATNEWLHVGDNPIIDYASARKAGLRALCYTTHTPDRYESALGQSNIPCYEDECLLPGRLAGTVRELRLRESSMDERQRLAHELGLKVGGPIFVSFVYWILREAKQLGLERLYFIARDGQILLEIARQMAQSQGLEMRYLYGSRAAWRTAAIHHIDSKSLAGLFQDDHDLTIAALARRLNTDEPALMRALETADALPNVLLGSANLSAIDVRRIRAAAVRPPLSDFVISCAANARQAAVAYFRQEGLFDAIPRGVVDLGWAGTLQDALDSIVCANGGSKIEAGFYAGLKTGYSPTKRAFYFNDKTHALARRVGLDSALLLELLAMADHSGVIGYQMSRDGKSAPVFGPDNNAHNAWPFAAFRAGVLRFATLYPQQIQSAGTLNVFRDSGLKIMAQIARNPSRDEAELLGNIPYSTDMTEAGGKVFAPALSLGQAIQRRFRLLLGRSDPSTASGFMSAARSRPLTAFLLAPRRTKSLMVNRLIMFFSRIRGVRRVGGALATLRDTGFED